MYPGFLPNHRDWVIIIDDSSPSHCSHISVIGGEPTGGEKRHVTSRLRSETHPIPRYLTPSFDPFPALGSRILHFYYALSLKVSRKFVDNQGRGADSAI